MSDYEALKTAGHSAAKAAEIILDAKRGDDYAKKWVAACRAMTRGGHRAQGTD